MDFVTTKENLLRELDVMQGIVEKKSTIPILSNIVIDAGKDRLELLATDLEVGIRTSCEAKITRPGSITLSARRLFDIAEIRGRRLDPNHLPEGALPDRRSLQGRLSRHAGV